MDSVDFVRQTDGNITFMENVHGNSLHTAGSNKAVSILEKV